MTHSTPVFSYRTWDVTPRGTSFPRGPPATARSPRAMGAVACCGGRCLPVDRLYDAFVDESLRRRWLPAGDLRQRTATKPKSARFDWGDGEARVNVTFTAKGAEKSTAALQHARLADAGEAERMKAYWRDGVASLKEVLER